jgi:O-succinylbenzoate synthase
LHVLRDFFVPGVLGEHDLSKLSAFRGHPMARMALEAAFWSAVAAERGVPLGDLLSDGAPRKERVSVGVSIGIQSSIDATLAVIERRLRERLSAHQAEDQTWLGRRDVARRAQRLS